jgi:RHS repeat-associated protein
MTDSSGTKIGEQGHFPFGESWYASSTTTKWQFTSYERDSESGNDYAMARYHVNRLGRFSSPDLLAGSTVNPQSLNRYTYVLDDTINRVDPLGLTDCLTGNPCVEAPSGGGGGSDAGPIEPDLPSVSGELEHTVPITVESIGILAQGTLDTSSTGVTAADGSTTPGGGTGGSGGGGGTDALKKTAKDLTKKKLNKKKCLKDLALLQTTGDKVRAGAQAANIQNGVGSSVPLSSLYATSPVPGVPQAGASLPGTVGDKLAEPGTVAVSQLGGPNIYVNPGMIDPTKYFQNLGTAFHEVLHNVTGLTDQDIERAFELSENGPTSQIDQKLIRDCF